MPVIPVKTGKTRHLNCQEEDMLLLKVGVEPSLLSATHSNEVKMACFNHF